MSKPVDVLIIAAIPNEVEQIRRDLVIIRTHAAGRASAVEARLQLDALGLDVAFCASGPGLTPMTAITVELLSHFSPRLLLMIGCAGGLKDVELGDVVCGEQVTLYARGKASNYGQFAGYGLAYRGDANLVQLARTLALGGEWNDGKPYHVGIGEILSGEVVQTDPAEIHHLKQRHPKGLCIETEGYGFMEGAAGSPQIPALVIRGISDMGANKAATDAENWQQRATQRAWQVARRLLALHFSVPGRRAQGSGGTLPAAQIPLLPDPYLPRPEVVSQLSDLLAREGSPIHLLQGAPGLGKTCMAIEFARSGMARQPLRWVPLGPRATVLQAGVDLLNVCGLPEAIEAITPRDLRRLAKGRAELDDIVVVLDDAWDAALLSSLALLLGPRARLLVTTRLPRVADALDNPARFALPALTTTEARALFDRHAMQAAPLSQEAGVARYIDSLQGVPLSLRVAGRLFAHRLRDHFSSAEIIAGLAGGSSLLDQRVRDVSGLAEELEPTLRQIVASSIEALSVEDRADFIKLAPFGASQQRFTLPTLQGLWGGDPRIRASRLVEMGIIERSGEEYSMHAAFGWMAQELAARA
jgi:nucleoside phosphorylase